MSNTNFGDLVQCSPQARNAWRWVKSIGAMTVIVGGAFWCGASTGYWVGASTERERSQQEVARLQEAYGVQLSLLTDKTEAAADVAQAAASAAVQATQRPAPGKHATPSAP